MYIHVHETYPDVHINMRGHGHVLRGVYNDVYIPVYRHVFRHAYSLVTAQVRRCLDICMDTRRFIEIEHQ